MSERTCLGPPMWLRVGRWAGRTPVFLAVSLIGCLPAAATTYVMPEDFSVACLNLHSGETLWEQAPGPLRRPRIYVVGSVVVADDPVRPTQNLMDPVITAGTEKFHRYFLDAETGTPLAVTALPESGPVPTGPLRPLEPNMTAADGTTFVFDPGNTRHLVARTTDSGERIVRRLPGYPHDLHIVDDLAIFTFAGGVSEMDTGGGAVYAFRFARHHLGWRFDASTHLPGLPGNTWTGIAVDGDRVLVSAGQTVFALKARSGELLWRCDLPRQDIARFDSAWTTIARMSDRLIVQCYNALFCLDAGTGRLVWHRPCGFLASPWPTVTGDHLLVGSRKGAVALASTTLVSHPPPATGNWWTRLRRDGVNLPLAALWMPWIFAVVAAGVLLARGKPVSGLVKGSARQGKASVGFVSVVAIAFCVLQVSTQLLLPVPFRLYVAVCLLYIVALCATVVFSLLPAAARGEPMASVPPPPPDALPAGERSARKTRPRSSRVVLVWVLCLVIVGLVALPPLVAVVTVAVGEYILERKAAADLAALKRLASSEDKQPPPIEGLLFTIGKPGECRFGRFGDAIATAGGKIVVGAPMDNKAFIFDGVTGKLLLRLEDPSAAETDYFGARVASIGSNVLVTGAGAVHLFDGGTGQLLHTFEPPARRPRQDYGAAVIAVGPRLVISAHQDGGDGDEPGPGAVYVYDGASCEMLYRIDNPDPGEVSDFGETLGAAAGRIIVGAPWGCKGSPGGRVYVFDADNGRLLLKINDPEPLTPESRAEIVQAMFGSAVAGIGANIVVAARQRGFGVRRARPKTGPRKEGAVYLFDGATGKLLLTFARPVAGGVFGAAIATSGNRVYIGNIGYAGDEEVFGFDAVTGRLLQTIQSANRDYNNHIDRGGFGSALAPIDANIVIGAPGADASTWREKIAFEIRVRETARPPYPPRNDTGAVYVFRGPSDAGASSGASGSATSSADK